mgnify:CR=1 FL=1
MKNSNLDWRLQGQEKYLLGCKLTKQRYKPLRLEGDHDHCEFCFAKFSETNKESEKEGFVTLDGYRWICNNCFNDFKDKFKWEIQ